jgi:alpha-glucosidase
MNRAAAEAARPDGDWVIFSRSGWTGEQGVAQIVWIGDQEADWTERDGLPTVVPALLNLGLSGVPFVTHDIGGFSGGPRTKELFLRWTELGAFTPVMRTHEGLARVDNWDWDSDAETVAHFRRFARVHAALAPTWARLADEAVSSGMPLLRALGLVFPDDPESRRISDEFLVGDDLLVAPVLLEGATTREVYLPPGVWFDVWTGERYDGGRRLSMPAPIGRPPVFSRSVDRSDLRAIEG